MELILKISYLHAQDKKVLLYIVFIYLYQVNGKIHRKNNNNQINLP